MTHLNYVQKGRSEGDYYCYRRIEFLMELIAAYNIDALGPYTPRGYAILTPSHSSDIEQYFRDKHKFDLDELSEPLIKANMLTANLFPTDLGRAYAERLLEIPYPTLRIHWPEQEVSP